MKRLLATLMMFGFLGSAAYAHCGDCDSSESHSHEAKTSIVSVAKEAGSFKTLLKAAEAAGLVETLMGEGPYTVFAPTDEAFAKLPEGTVESLLQNPEQLKSVLLYHVVPGKKMAGDVVSSTSLKSAQGQSLDIRATDGSVMVENAKVIKTDIVAGNGVIHVIDTVVLPE